MGAFVSITVADKIVRDINISKTLDKLSNLEGSDILDDRKIESFEEANRLINPSGSEYTVDEEDLRALNEKLDTSHQITKRELGNVADYFKKHFPHSYDGFITNNLTNLGNNDLLLRPPLPFQLPKLFTDLGFRLGIEEDNGIVVNTSLFSNEFGGAVQLFATPTGYTGSEAVHFESCEEGVDHNQLPTLTLNTNIGSKLIITIDPKNLTGEFKEVYNGRDVLIVPGLTIIPNTDRGLVALTGKRYEDAKSGIASNQLSLAQNEDQYEISYFAGDSTKSDSFSFPEDMSPYTKIANVRVIDGVLLEIQYSENGYPYQNISARSLFAYPTDNGQWVSSKPGDHNLQPELFADSSLQEMIDAWF